MLTNPPSATGMSTSNGQVPIGYRLYALTTLNNGLENPNEVQSAQKCILSEDYGVPQARHRIIVGVRADISEKPAPLRETPFKPTVRDAIGGMPRLRSGLSKGEDTSENWVQAICSQVNDYLIGKTKIDNSLRLRSKPSGKTRLLIEVRSSLRLNPVKELKRRQFAERAVGSTTWRCLAASDARAHEDRPS